MNEVRDGCCFICRREITVEEVLLEEIVDPTLKPGYTQAGWDKPYHKECYERLREKYAGDIGEYSRDPEGSEYNP